MDRVVKEASHALTPCVTSDWRLPWSAKPRAFHLGTGTTMRIV
ncbi:MAG TPA: hypothetical protein VL087_01500 [Nitrospirota bacterium]|nr:hypothetical protein [Nitrospirota bacterium]